MFALLPLCGCGGDSEVEPSPQTLASSDVAPATSEDIGSPEEPGTEPLVLFLGDSLTIGYGLDSAFSYPALIEAKIEAQGYPYEVVNAGVSGDTTAGGLRRFDWLAKRRIDVLVLALGGNDALRGVEPESTRKNLQGIIEKARASNPEIRIVLTGMQAPPNLGSRFTEPFRSLFPELAEKNQLDYVPFLLEGVAGDRTLNQADGIHPTAEGQEILAENVWKVLERVLRE